MNLFTKEFLKNFRSVGSVVPSSRFLSKKIMKAIDFSNANVIVELGAGTGKFTDALIKNKKKETLIVVFELNKNFYNVLKEKYKNTNNVILLNSCATTLVEKLAELNISKVDYIVSGLPFLSIPSKKRVEILESMKNSGAEEIVLFQYTKKLKKILGSHFEFRSQNRVFMNIPPAYVFCYGKK